MIQTPFSICTCINQHIVPSQTLDYGIKPLHEVHFRCCCCCSWPHTQYAHTCIHWSCIIRCYYACACTHHTKKINHAALLCTICTHMHTLIMHYIVTRHTPWSEVWKCYILLYSYYTYTKDQNVWVNPQGNLSVQVTHWYFSCISAWNEDTWEWSHIWWTNIEHLGSWMQAMAEVVNDINYNCN